MDRYHKQPGNPNSSRRSRRSQSLNQPNMGSTPVDYAVNPQDAALLAQFAATAGAPPPSGPHEYPREALAQMLGAAPGGPPSSQARNLHYPHPEHMGHPIFPSMSPTSFPWSQYPPQYPLQNPQYGSSNEGPSFDPSRPPLASGSGTSSYPTLPPIDASGYGRSRTGPAFPAVASTSTLAFSGQEQTEAEHMSISEDKRRRNTEASARFRIKKKQRSLNLEHTVSDLKGRAEELEREAAELRRENGWLKEIVILKGSGMATRGSESDLTGQRDSQRHAIEADPLARTEVEESDSDHETGNQGEESGSTQKDKGKDTKKHRPSNA